MTIARTVLFRTARVLVFDDHLQTRFVEDGSVNEFWPPVEDPDFKAAALEMGYGPSSVMQYGIEHDLTHHFVADELGWPHSWSIWSAAHAKPGALPGPGQKWSQRVADEEHIVNRLQKYINTGAVDMDYGVLMGRWGDRLPEVAGRLIRVLRPWIE